MSALTLHIEGMNAIPVAAEKAFMNGCAGKDRYPSESAADAALTAMKRGLLGRLHGDIRVDEMHSYECQFCGYWHHGH